MGQTLTTCTFCGVGCGLYLETRQGRLAGAYPSLSHPANRGRLCVRGWHVHEVAGSPERVRTPLLRRNRDFEEVTWEQAIGFLAERLADIRARYGPDALGFLNSPRCSNEESYLLQKLARAVLGTNNVDHGSGVYGHNSLNVLLETLGVPASTNSIAELSESDVILVHGVDLARRMPVVAGIVLRAKLRGAKLIVAGSRYHRVARSADLFLQILPGTDHMLYGALAKVILDRGLMDHAFIQRNCPGAEEFFAQARLYDVCEAAEACGVSPKDIEEAAQAYARARRAAILYSTGIEDLTRDSIRALVNLALMTGQIGKRGAGIFALNEHNNLQGVCDMGVLPDRLPGYRPVSDSGAREELGRLWNASLPAAPGMNARAMLSEAGTRKLRALWLGRCDPVSTAFIGDPGRLLDKLELVVAQHLFMTDTCRCAHVILPTTAFGEERVTFTSTERRVQLAERVVEPLPGTMPAWQQLALLAQALGAPWNYPSSSEVMDEIAEAVPFYSGVNHAALAGDFGRQWPCTKDQPRGTPRLFTNGAAQGLRFAPVVKPTIVPPPAKFPIVLIFGHSVHYWNQNSLVQHSETLRREHRILLLDYPAGFVEINPDDAKKLGIRDGQKVRMVAADGASARSTARLTDEVRAGTACVPYFVREVEREIMGDVAAGAALVWIRLEKEAA